MDIYSIVRITDKPNWKVVTDDEAKAIFGDERGDKWPYSGLSLEEATQGANELTKFGYLAYDDCFYDPRHPAYDPYY